MDSDDLDFEPPSYRARKRRLRRMKLLGTGTKKSKRLRRPTKWWVTKDSKVERDERFEDKPIGLGVFTTRRVEKKKIYFYGGEFI